METTDIGDVLAIVITALGCLLCLGVLFLLVQGKALPSDNTQPHRIAFKGLEVQTTQIVMVLIVSLLAALLPFLVHNWLKHEQMKSDREAKRELKRAVLKVGATVEEKPGVPASGQDYEASLFKVETQGEQPKTERIICDWIKLSNGEFDCRDYIESLEDTFLLRIRRKSDQGNTVSQKYIQPNEQRIFMTLSK